MSGPLRRRPSPKTTFDRIPSILHRQGEAIAELHKTASADFKTVFEELQRVREILADQMVQTETLKIQVAALLAMSGKPHE